MNEFGSGARWLTQKPPNRFCAEAADVRLLSKTAAIRQVR
jgi:hypothetical protein